MRLKKVSTDLIGNKHYRYQQYFKNLLIEGSELIVHEKGGKAISANGKSIKDFTGDVIPVINEAQALSAALSHLGAKEYYWQNGSREQQLKKQTKNSKATYFPKAELVFITRVTYSESVPEHVLAYKFVIRMSKPYDNTRLIYIDASNGTVVKNVDLETKCSHTTIQTNYNGAQTIGTYTNSFISGWDMEDDCSPTVIKVFDVRNDNNIFHDRDNSWTVPYELSAGSSMWAVKRSLDIYGVFFNRSGYDNDDSDINIYQGINFEDGNNASFTPGGYLGLLTAEVKVGLSTSDAVTDDWNTLDIMGHEVSHGVSNAETGWVGVGGETGALNEAFSDCMAEAIEYYVTGSTDWCLGCQRTLNAATSKGRNMADPIKSPGGPLPDTYLGDYWDFRGGPCDPDNNDNCGVHTNLGPMDYAFYLISHGGSGWNNGKTSHAAANDGCYYNISGIGIEKASQIFYHALDYLGDNSKYIQARDYTIQSAIDLFGPCSNEAIQVAEAWRAVGVGTGSSCLNNYQVCNVTLPYYRGNNFLIAGGICAANIPLTTPVQFAARDYISLLPGFTSALGTNFRAYIADCSFPAHRDGPPAVQAHIPASINKFKDAEKKNMKTASFSLFPNPARDYVNINYQFAGDKQVSITLNDAAGRVVKVIKAASDIPKVSHQTQLNVSALPNGIYFVKLIHEGRISIAKLVISK